MLGEHGETAVICEHATRVHRHPVHLPPDLIRQQLWERSPRIIAGMDRTQHGPAGAVLSTVRKLLGLADGHEELSAISPGGVYLGQQLRFVAGRYWNDPPEQSPTEQAALGVFLHPATQALLPWPAAAALGLGLLHAYGFLDGVRARLAAGQHLHPTVTTAILNGRTNPLRDPRGRELKMQLFPHQLTDWLGLQLARSATATALIFPSLDPGGEPSLDVPPRTLTTSDFFDPDHDDRYPDFLRLTRITPEHRNQIWAHTRNALAAVPHHSVVLTHDTARSRQLLAAQATVGRVGLETS